MLVQRISRLAGIAAVFAMSSTASAQSWQAIGPTSGAGGNFWNNVSSDNSGVGNPNCNIGAILTGVAVNAGCSNEAPANMLPLALSPAPTHFLGGAGGASTGFYFGAGSWNVTLLGTITGASPVRPWNIIDYATNVSLGTVTMVGNTFEVSTAQGFYLDISSWAPVGGTYDSRAGGQFAAFGANATGPTIVGANLGRIDDFGGTYYVGMEDNACLQAGCMSVDGYAAPASDYDFNDVVLQIRAVPEPTTVGLMAIGLFGLAAAARRRRLV